MKKKLTLIAVSLLLSPLISLGMVAGVVAFSLQVGYFFAMHHLAKLFE